MAHDTVSPNTTLEPPARSNFQGLKLVGFCPRQRKSLSTLPRCKTTKIYGKVRWKEMESTGCFSVCLIITHIYFATNIRLLSLHSRTRRMILAPLLFRLPHVLRTMARTIYHLRSLIAPEITSHQQLSTKSHCIIIITNRHKPTSAPIYSLAFHNLIQQVMLALRPRFDLIHFDATTNAPSSNGPVIIII